MYTIGREVFRMGERQDIFKTLDAVINLIREKQDSEHFLSQVVDKVGIGYINQQVFGRTKKH
jgi:NAD(P)H-nitrite reductase large subunit